MKVKKILAFVLIVTMLLMQSVMVMSAEETSDLMWHFDDANGSLYIEGMGAMPDFKAEPAPWDEYASEVREIFIGGDLTTVGRYAFRNCVNVAYVYIESKKLEIIEEAAFLGCTEIRVLDLPASLKMVEAGAFYNCRHIEEIIFEGTQERWNEIDFGNNRYLLSAYVRFEDVTYEPEMPDTPDDNLTWSFDEDTGELVIDGEGYMSDYPEYDTRPWADYISQITSIKIGDNVTGIGERAFMYCEQLTSIEFGESLEIIGEAAFAHCVSLWEITIPDSVTYIDGNAFFNCCNLNEITFGAGLLEIDECGSFSECRSLTQIVLPDSVERLGVAAFESCDNLQKIYIPACITTIENRVFNCCEALTDVYYAGTQEQWEQMVINEYNDGLDNANIHFNCIGLTEPDEPTPDLPTEPTVTVSFDNVKTEYEYGEEFYVEVYEVADGMTKQVYDYTIEGFNRTQSGMQTVIVRYGDYEEIFTVYVNKAVESEPDVPVDPENAPVVTVSTERSRKGETVDVIVSLSKNTGFANLGLEIEYDKEVFNLVNVTGNAAVGATFTKAQSLDAYPYNIGWDSISNVNYNGELVTLTFEVAENAVAGEYLISIDFYKGRNGDYSDGNAVNYDENENALGLLYVDGAVTVYDYIPGDINDDGSVNNKDGTAILRYLAGWTLESINEDALDTDGDGIITNKDGTRILRYLAGWDVELN